MELFDIIATIESNKNFQAMRFEPVLYSGNARAFNDIILRISKINKCNKNTARIIYCTSWGAVQIMGFNIYNPIYRYGGTIIDFINNESDQRNLFNDFVTLKKINYLPQQLAESKDLRDSFATHYNGTNNISVYSDLISKSLITNGFKVI